MFFAFTAPSIVLQILSPFSSIHGCKEKYNLQMTNTLHASFGPAAFYAGYGVYDIFALRVAFLLVRVCFAFSLDWFCPTRRLDSSSDNDKLSSLREHVPIEFFWSFFLRNRLPSLLASRYDHVSFSSVSDFLRLKKHFFCHVYSPRIWSPVIPTGVFHMAPNNPPRTCPPFAPPSILSSLPQFLPRGRPSIHASRFGWGSMALLPLYFVNGNSLTLFLSLSSVLGGLFAMID